jgi:UDP-N-acetylmuramoylalanine--D-glutamate ligase
MNTNIKPPIAILGFGVEGQSALKYIQRLGIKDVTVLDEKPVDGAPEECHIISGPKAFKNLTRYSTIIRSPGVHYNRPEIIKAREAGAFITSMTQLTLEVGADRLTAITGSNGKTTTTALTAEILKKYYGDKIIVGGNDRKPTVEEAMDNPGWPILMEVSSFQFADANVSPHISAVLNITPNHMDWHEDLQDYINAKNNLIRHQTKNDWAILNTNNEDSAKLAGGAPGKVFWVGKNKSENWTDWIDNKIVVNGETIIGHDEILVKTHSDNLLFAAAIAKIHNVPNNLIAEVMKEFRGVEHRLEFVKTINGINFYNDSSCTTPESAEVAIEQFPLGKLILMLGGSSKNADFSFLAAKIKDCDVRVYLYGLEGTRIKDEIEKIGGENLIIKYNPDKKFENIVKDVYKNAKSGDNVVLSPACASFDMFKNAKYRGYEFKELVHKLA